MIKRNIALFSLVMMFLQAAELFGYPNGITGRTLKTSKNGCGGCHGSSATSGVLVTLTGPDTVVLNQSTTFILTISGGPALGSGCDIAAKYGSLSQISSSLKISGGELTQVANTAMSGGSVTFEFSYVYSGVQAIDSLYATGLSTNSNGGSSGDNWNWATNKRIVIVTQNPPPATPVLLTPANQTNDQPVSLQLMWHSVPSAATYHVQLATDSLFTAIVINDSALVDTLKLASSLLNNTPYYWHVRAKNTGGTSAWSGTWKFTTITTMPDPVILIQPANGTQFNVDTVIFSWNRTNPNVLKYWFEIASDSVFAASQIDSNLTDTVITVRNLTQQPYWWRVRAYNNAGWGTYSEIRHFTISSTGVGDEGILTYNIKLNQNYPNPFNPNTAIRFEISKTSFVALKVYDVLGQEIATLVDENRVAGQYQVDFDGSKLPSGVYFYRLQVVVSSSTSEKIFAETKKLLLMK